ncbi:2-hydroxyglutarate dehydrogenase [Angomonas deanei]|nr:2-hydroxyglutarate dehydrogenase [Angomonas deanei]|eukprot:EPY29882.1 2-hydroxyglutarate dehydrogenase [Angomonas deanei]
MYYKPGTAMARLCPRGHDLIVDYCKKKGVIHEMVGKLIVASSEDQVKTIEEVYANGVANGVKDMKLIYGDSEIKKKEPNITGLAAIWSPQTGITDFAAVTRSMLKDLSADAKHFATQFQFEAQDFIGVHLSPKEEVVLIRGRESGHHGPEKTVVARRVITCCGLNNDALAKYSGNVLSRAGKRIVQTYSFRGRYYQLTPEKRSIITSHVYPCPDTRKGMSVGVHFTPTVDERRGRQVIIGPGSAVAFDRFGYSPYLVDLEYLFNCAFSKGGWVSLASNAKMICQMYYMDLSRAVFLREAQKLIPEIRNEDIEDSFCGVQAIGIDEAGGLAKDLSIEFCRPKKTFPGSLSKTNELKVLSDSPVAAGTTPLILNVRNAPSPGRHGLHVHRGGYRRECVQEPSVVRRVSPRF